MKRDPRIDPGGASNDFPLCALLLLLGGSIFFLIAGPRALYPTNIAWLADGDPATHYLGWAFFRDSSWSFPIGRNPDYGLDLSSAVVYSDSIPLLAFLFKPFSSLLPRPFQYFGIWLLLCFLMQAWLGAKLVGLVSESRLVRVLGAGLFCLAPPMLWRLQGHLSLAGHFLVLAALYLALRPNEERRAWLWGAVLCAAALTHPYFLGMTGALWIADLAGRVAENRQRARGAIGESVGLIGLVAPVCWQAGYFVVGAGAASVGYGFYRLNLLALFDPSSWSYVLRDFPEGPGDYEGFGYLGLGVLGLVLFSVPGVMTRKESLKTTIPRKPFLIVVLAGLSLFAITPHVGIGPFNVTFPISEHLEKLANVFRSSGRMFWPAYYMILLSAIALIVRNNHGRTATALLFLAFIVQTIDTSAGWKPIRKVLMKKASAEWSTPLRDRFWAEAAGRYESVRLIRPGNKAAHWRVFAAYAAAHGLSTDAAYLARVNMAGLEAANRRANEMLRTGSFDKNTLYVVEDILAARAIGKIDASVDLLAEVDGFYVLAPGWKACGECPSAGKEARRIGDIVKPVTAGDTIQFNEAGKGRNYLLHGWYLPEKWGTWSEGTRAGVFFPLSGRASRVVIEANPLISRSHPKQTVTIEINGTAVWEADLATADVQRIEVVIPEPMRESVAREGQLDIEFRLPDAARPADIGINADTRMLALGLRSISVF